VEKEKSRTFNINQFFLEWVNTMEMNKTEIAFGRLYEIIGRLRAPDGCPWDREQTPETMRSDLVEECFEAVDAINQKDAMHVKEELGDVILNASMISYMYEQAGGFSLASVLNDVSDKIVRRHPHVFPESCGKEYALEGGAKTSEEVLTQWEKIKTQAEGRSGSSILDSVSKGMPQLMQAYKIQKKAAKVGFDWENIEEVFAKVNEEIDEVKSAENQEHLEEEIGDLLFAVVNLARKNKVDPTMAMERANEKFRKRFAYIEKKMSEVGLALEKENFQKMDDFWNESKRNVEN
jgi:tetrapyrrole methylase family protein/MazG family protein